MKRYIGTKTIEAEPMTAGEFYASRDLPLPFALKEEDEGYKVVYPDGYKSWSPKKVFEEAYHELLIEPDGNNFIKRPVYPAEELTIAVAPDPDYGGAHRYQFKNYVGYSKDGGPGYHDSYQEIHFVQKNIDGSMSPGLQSEQLLIALVDRHNKLNDKFPSEHGKMAIIKMEEALFYLSERVSERIDRGVIGDLKK